MQDDQNSAEQSINVFINILYLLVGLIVVYLGRSNGGDADYAHVGFFGTIFEYILGGGLAVLGGNIGEFIDGSIKYRAIGCVVGCALGVSLVAYFFG